MKTQRGGQGLVAASESGPRGPIARGEAVLNGSNNRCYCARLCGRCRRAIRRHSACVPYVSGSISELDSRIKKATSRSTEVLVGQCIVIGRAPAGYRRRADLAAMTSILVFGRRVLSWLTGLGPGAASGFARMIDPRAAPTGAISTPRTYPGGVVRKSRPAPVRVTPWSMGRGLMELGSSGTAIP